MMRSAIAAVLLAAAGAASAQSPDPKRVAEIWESVYDRMGRQTDAWFKDGDFPRTVQLLRLHYSLDPTNYEVGTNLGYMLENIELNDEALAVYIRLRTTNPSDPDDAWPEANFYFRRKAFEKVPAILEPTIKDHDPHPNNYRTLAHAYEKLNMLADSKRVWEKYLGKHPDDGAAKLNLARVIKKMKEGGKRKP
jgi:tetratricopeptide (TPR) repeat protein